MTSRLVFSASSSNTFDSFAGSASWIFGRSVVSTGAGGPCGVTGSVGRVSRCGRDRTGGLGGGGGGGASGGNVLAIASGVSGCHFGNWTSVCGVDSGFGGG